MIEASSAAASPREASGLVRAFWELSKPGVTRVVLITTALGVIATPSAFTWSDLIPTVIGTGLVVAGANALNMLLERESDRLMTRTQTRPLPTGRIAPDVALCFGVAVSILGLGVLAQFVSMLAVALAAGALLSYVLVYTPLKRVSPIALYVGAVPGALPPAIGYAALTGTWDRIAWCLFLILLVWQIPHFLAITIFRRDDYARAGLRVLSVVRGIDHTKKAIVAFSLALLVTTLLPYFFGLVSLPYLFVALSSGLFFLAYSVRNLFTEDVQISRKLFFSSMPHLILVKGAFVLTII